MEDDNLFSLPTSGKDWLRIKNCLLSFLKPEEPFPRTIHDVFQLFSRLSAIISPTHMRSSDYFQFEGMLRKSAEKIAKESGPGRYSKHVDDILLEAVSIAANSILFLEHMIPSPKISNGKIARLGPSNNIVVVSRMMCLALNSCAFFNIFPDSNDNMAFVTSIDSKCEGSELCCCGCHSSSHHRPQVHYNIEKTACILNYLLLCGKEWDKLENEYLLMLYRKVPSVLVESICMGKEVRKPDEKDTEYATFDLSKDLIEDISRDIDQGTKVDQFDQSAIEVVSTDVSMLDAKTRAKYNVGDFANRHIGGGVFNRGSVQEEIMFMIAPDLCISKLLCETLVDDDAVWVIGGKPVSNYTGYSREFQYAGRCATPAKYAKFGGFSEKKASKHRIVKTPFYAINILDAINFGKGSPVHEQTEGSSLLREITKATASFLRPYLPCIFDSIDYCLKGSHPKRTHSCCGCGEDHVEATIVAVKSERFKDKKKKFDISSSFGHNFCENPMVSSKKNPELTNLEIFDRSTPSHDKNAIRLFNLPIMGGRWGCGAFGGDPQVKSAIQMLAIQIAGVIERKRHEYYETKSYDDESGVNFGKYPNFNVYTRGNRLTLSPYQDKMMFSSIDMFLRSSLFGKYKDLCTIPFVYKCTRKIESDLVTSVTKKLKMVEKKNKKNKLMEQLTKDEEEKREKEKREKERLKEEEREEEERKRREKRKRKKEEKEKREAEEMEKSEKEKREKEKRERRSRKKESEEEERKRREKRKRKKEEKEKREAEEMEKREKEKREKEKRERRSRKKESSGEKEDKFKSPHSGKKGKDIHYSASIDIDSSRDQILGEESSDDDDEPVIHGSGKKHHDSKKRQEIAKQQERPSTKDEEESSECISYSHESDFNV
ncbi:Poly(ADP-ribose) glycohydrolase like protein [Aduncisulcus paluster]|uniref:Poly(ADP-ribose) glycohydrolase like protein n=1 Tax=Aduncisulcus paluster TaxID=2918883 RepID=A0ABQ5KTG7_9EUKA|nr:Poly(ADP-ribose) glycohydrolase like protein [Aduncisulcus paluster]